MRIFVQILLVAFVLDISFVAITSAGGIHSGQIEKLDDNDTKIITDIRSLKLAYANGVDPTENVIDCERLVADFERQYLVPSRDDGDIGYFHFMENHDLMYSASLIAANPSEQDWIAIVDKTLSDIEAAKKLENYDDELHMFFKSALLFAPKFHIAIGDKYKAFDLSHSNVCASKDLNPDTLLSHGGYDAAMIGFLRLEAEGNVDASYKIGVLYAEGLGVAKDEYEAERYHLKAAKSGNTDAMLDLALLYSKDNTIEEKKNYPKAYAWLLQAASLNNAEALFNLSNFHHIGLIYPPYRSDGIRYVMLSQNAGWEYTESMSEIIFEGLSAKSIDKLRQQLADCEQPFSKRCEVSKHLETEIAYVRISDIELIKFKKGFLFDSYEREKIDTFFNNFIRDEIPIPVLFSKKHTRFFPNKNKPSKCRVMGEDMRFVWYSNANIPDGKALEFGEKDYIEFACKSVRFADLLN